jgi:catechol 2,3-dioxygenase-like lactoylglutathione lyase family enzyme
MQQDFRTSGVSVIMLGVSNLEQSLAFYRDKLGLAVKMQLAELALLRKMAGKLWRREWDSRTPLSTTRWPSMRYSQPQSLPTLKFYHTCNMRHRRNIH